MKQYKTLSLTTTFLVCGILQCLYIFGCIVVMVCMPLYTAFYPSEFSDICFGIGAVMNLISFLNPIAMICWIVILIAFCIDRSAVQNKRIKIAMVIWLMLSPILSVLCWIGSVCSFVAHSGGV